MPLYIVWEILTRISIHYYNLQFHIFLKKKKKKKNHIMFNMCSKNLY